MLAFKNRYEGLPCSRTKFKIIFVVGSLHSKFCLTVFDFVINFYVLEILTS